MNVDLTSLTRFYDDMLNADEWQNSLISVTILQWGCCRIVSP